MSAETAADGLYETPFDIVKNTSYCAANKHAMLGNTIAVPVRSYNVETSKKQDTPMIKKCGIVLTCLMALLIGIALIIVATVTLVQIAQLRSDAVLQSTSPGMLDTADSESLFNQLSLLISKTTGNTNILATMLINVLTQSGYSFASCAAIQQRSPTSPSGNYYIRSSNGSAVLGFCDMNSLCGNIAAGWMKVAELDMTDNTTQCPSSLELLTSPRRTCRIRSSDAGLCSSDTFTVDAVGYSKVCGRITAYQVGSPDAFANRQLYNIANQYVDGVSLTHGASPRQHIWTFAVANNEDGLVPKHKCRCTNTNISSLVPLLPSYVGEDYFCDTGALAGFAPKFHTDDPLWDGAGCGPQSTCCSFNNPPWFYKQLPQPTTDDIEMRVCRDEARANEDIAIEVVEIYVQ